MPDPLIYHYYRMIVQPRRISFALYKSKGHLSSQFISARFRWTKGYIFARRRKTKELIPYFFQFLA
ncbi:hypothetical protein CW304_20870 [Bacillus sp. UFRGS-B20]|nr:hypothetical protein CW304_20870 [Bacillus sp. UFRGS-B20]